MDHTKNLRVHSKRTLKSVINGTVKKFLRSKDLSKIIISIGTPADHAKLTINRKARQV